MKNPPCVRSLKRFERKGCPQKSWDGEEGCPCWIEMSIAERGNPLKKEIRKQCLDIWIFEFQWAAMGLLEGNQQATETFRNGMLQKGSDGKNYPKPDPSIIALIKLIKEKLQEKTLIENCQNKTIIKEIYER